MGLRVNCHGLGNTTCSHGNIEIKTDFVCFTDCQGECRLAGLSWSEQNHRGGMTQQMREPCSEAPWQHACNYGLNLHQYKVGFPGAGGQGATHGFRRWGSWIGRDGLPRVRDIRAAQQRGPTLDQEFPGTDNTYSRFPTETVSCIPAGLKRPHAVFGAHYEGKVPGSERPSW